MTARPAPDSRVDLYAAWLKSVNPNKLADAFHSDLARIQIAELESAGLLVLDPGDEDNRLIMGDVIRTKLGIGASFADDVAADILAAIAAPGGEPT